MIILAEADWRARQAAHERRVRAWTDPHQARAARGEPHPVYDFLFHYYAFRPAWLRRWHPGPDVGLAAGSGASGEPDGAREFLRWTEYRTVTLDDGRSVVTVDPAGMSPGRRVFVAWLRQLLGAMESRPAFFGCYGLHEWAMVYRQTPEERRHRKWPLRFEPEELARIVEENAICCSHFDAFRFFTAPARPLNRLQPTRADVPALEQRGCLHANMDLYKWAFKLAPFTPAVMRSELWILLAKLVRAVGRLVARLDALRVVANFYLMGLGQPRFPSPA